MSFAEVYESAAQQLVAPLVIPALFLGWWLAAQRGRREASAARRFLQLYCPLFAAEALLDPLATGLLPPALGLGDAGATALAFAFVWLGDFRVLWLVLTLLDAEPAPRRAAPRAALLACAVPAVDGVALALGAGGQGLWLVHELAFLGLALWLGQGLIPGRAPAQWRGPLRAAAGYAAAYYALWALCDALILWGGLDAAWGLRMLPNQLYYAFWVPFVFAAFLARTDAGWIRTASWRRAIGVGCVLLVVLAAGLMAGIIHRQVLNVPFWDDWETLILITDWHSGVLSFDDLWRPHAGHRIIVARLLTIGLARIAGWNNITQVYAAFTVAALTVVLLWRMLALTMRGRNELLAPTVLVSAAALLFSPRQAQNWVQGFNFGWFLTVFFGVAAIWCVARFPGSWFGLLGALLAAVTATFSIGSGLAVWVVVLAGMALRHRVWGLRAIAVWAVAAAIAFAAYFLGLGTQLDRLSWLGAAQVPAEERSALIFVLRRLPQTAAFLVCTLGAPLSGFYEVRLAAAAGATGLAALVWACWELWRHPGGGPHPRWVDALPWVQVASFGILAGALIAFGRVFFGTEYALLSRYVTSANLFWVGLFGTLALALHDVTRDGRLPRVAAITAPVAALALVVGYARAYQNGSTEMQLYRARLHTALFFVYRSQEAPLDLLQLTHPLTPRWLRSSIAAARLWHEGPFLPGAEQAYDAGLAREARSWNERLSSSAYTVRPSVAIRPIAGSADALRNIGAGLIFAPRKGPATFRAALPPSPRRGGARVVDVRSAHALAAAVSWSASPGVDLYPLPGGDGAPHFRMTVPSSVEEVEIGLTYRRGQRVPLDAIWVDIYERR